MRRPFTTSSPRLAVAAVPLALLALTSCSEDDGDPETDDRATAIEALSTALAEDTDPGNGQDPILEDGEVECMATSLVDELGVDTLVDEGILDNDLTKATLPEDTTSTSVKTANAAAISDCVGIVDYWLRTTRLVLTTLAEQQGEKRYDLSDAQWAEILACAEKRLPEAAVRKRAVNNPDQPLLSEKQLARLEPCEPEVFGQ
ncbi:hypothetical protein ACFQ0K_06500 [Nocardioides caeni]|uniref:Uncharacterized protein n=1 Tax=Nocardioides caeni TaxID=574700 RepID=A0A4S8N986_9ACTN|nr:hypothetical protein [Nocardioides caeni]THV12920.1 hypothetical protein E9934_11085 [Nocardioides caeni]